MTLSLVAYSTPQAAYAKIIKAFQATPAGKNVKFTQSYGASGDQSRAVAAGQKADIVAFSLAPDIDRLVTANLVAADWNSNQYKGMVTDSVVVIATRKGNPKNIKTWDDLIKPGVSVISPNPISSGGARWNVMAAYGAESNKGADAAAGMAYLNKLFPQIAVQDTSARASLQTFICGKGDAMIAYENDAIFAQQNGQPLDYTVPDSTILIENPVAVTSNSAHPAQAKAFLDFLYTPTAQKIYAAERLPPDRARHGHRQAVVPDAVEPVHDRRPRRLDEGHDGLLRRQDRLGDGDRAAARRADDDHDAEGIGDTLTTGSSGLGWGPDDRTTAVAEPRAIPYRRLTDNRVLTTTRQRRCRQTKNE